MRAHLGDLLMRMHQEEDAAGATEYIILLILIACVVIGIVKVYGETVSEKYEDGKEKVRRDVTY